MSFRNEQVAKELLKGLSMSISNTIPTERYGLITITDVLVSNGLENAKVFVSSFKHTRDLIKLLNSKTKKIIIDLHHQVNLRKIPQLKFVIDESQKRVERLEKLIEKNQNT